MEKLAPHSHRLYQHHFHYFNLASPVNRLLAVFLSIVILTAVVVFFRNSFSFATPSLTSFQTVNYQALLTAAGATLLRLIIAYGMSLVLAIIITIGITSNKTLESVALPVIDVLQSVPVLAFFPLAALAFAEAGFLEGAALLVLILAMVFNIVFTLVVAIHTIPTDVELAARNYGASGWRYFFYVIVPALFPAIVTGSILAWGQAWNITIVAEFINYGSIHQYLPGLGATLDQAASSSGSGNTALFISALIALVIIVILLNRLVWQPLINFSERFKFD